MNVNLEYYKIFYQVAKCQGITLAAKELCITQPAVSQAVKALEGEWGTTLFVRTSKGVRLTKEGELLFGYVAEGYEHILEGEERLKKMLNLDAGEIRIGASDTALRCYLLPHLEEFHRNYPNIKINVTNTPTPETLEHLQMGRIDFGIVTAPLPTEKNLCVRKVREVEDVFVAGNKFWSYKNRLLTYDMLNQLPVICLEGNTSMRSYLDEFLGEMGLTLKPEFEMATHDIIVHFALRNMGIGCVILDFAESYIQSGQLFQLHFDKKLPKRAMYVAYNAQEGLSSAASEFLQMMSPPTPPSS